MAGATSPEVRLDEPRDIYSISPQHRFQLPAAPTPRTSFVGREREIAAVQTLLNRSDVSVITLTGPGGVGKTRTAIRAVTESRCLAGFVDLSDVQQPGFVLPAIAAAFGVHTAGRQVLDSLTAAFRDDALLLVLDNFEQVLPAGAALAELLSACPQLKALITSRAVLGIHGEHVVDIRPLPLATLDRAGLDHHATVSDSCQLFVDRAQALDPEFALNRANNETVIAICQRVDGLPLAIELAAAWIPVLTPRDLLAQLEGRLNLLSIGPPRVELRHRTMRDTIAWSFGLLDEQSQRLFRRLAVFMGGFSLEAMREVCGDGSPEVLRELRALVANSLVRRLDQRGADSRYVMLETVREFALESLELSGESEVINDRYARYYLALAKRVESKLNTQERDIWLDRLEAEQGNLHRVLGWAIERGDAEFALDLAGSLLPFWQFRFHSSVGRDWVQQALFFDGEISAPVRRKALFCAGTLSYMNGDVKDAERHLTAAFAQYLEADDPLATGYAELSLGRITWDKGNLIAARTWFDSARSRFELRDDKAGVAQSLHYLGLVEFTDRQYEQGATYLSSAAQIWQSIGFTWELTCCIPGHLADIARATGDLDEAMARYQECLSLNWDRQDLENVAWSLVGLAIIAHEDEETERATRLAALAEQFRVRVGAPLTPHIERDHHQATQMIVKSIGAERVQATLAAVRDTPPETGIAEALAMTRKHAPTRTTPVDYFGLTPRELEVLRLMASGKSNRELASMLFVSPGTIKVRVTHILAKLDLPSRSAATDYAHRHQLV